MVRRITRSIDLMLCVLLPLISACAVSGQPNSTGSEHQSQYDFTPVTQAIQATVARTHLDGAAMLVAKDGQTIYKQRFGSYTDDTVVSLASGSKWMSAAAILTLVDEGKLALDDRVATYIPMFTGDKATMTIRQLLSHTAGLPDEVPCLNARNSTLAACVDQIAQVDLIADPGTAFCYGGTSFQVAGRIAEIASGQSWHQLFAERIAKPLGMTATDYQPDLRPANPRIAGGAHSNLHDYSIFLQMLLDNGRYNGTRILSSNALQLMMADQTGGVPISCTPHPIQTTRYGLGVWRDLVSASGDPLQISSPGKSGFTPWIDLERNMLAIFLVEDMAARDRDPLIAIIQPEIRLIIDAGPTGSTKPIYLPIAQTAHV